MKKKEKRSDPKQHAPAMTASNAPLTYTGQYIHAFFLHFQIQKNRIFISVR